MRLHVSFLAALAASGLCLVAPAMDARTVVIPDGTEVRIILKERLSSATAELDQKVRFEVAEDVIVGNVTVIHAGAQAWGHVIERRKRGKFGKNGKLNFTVDFVKAVDGRNIRLSGTKRREGDNEYAKAGVIAYLTSGVGGLFVKGKDVEVDAGTEWTIYVDGDRRINLGSPLQRAVMD